MSLHNSGKILLGLYANGVLRMWNMMEARCKYKRKVNVLTEFDMHSDHEDEDLEVTELRKKDLTEYQKQPVSVLWEPSQGQLFCILFNNLLEVFNVNDESAADLPCSFSVFDIQLTSVAFIGVDSLVASDVEGNLQVLSNIKSQEGLGLKTINTKFERIRQGKCLYEQSSKQFQFLAAISTDSRIAVWDRKRISEFDHDLGELKADRVVKAKDKLTCLQITDFSHLSIKKTKLLGKRTHQQAS